MAFPQNFVWGAAAASYQIEGAALVDGKGLSIWDMLCRQEGKIYNGDTGDVACDHYHRYPDDIALMQAVGLQAYRLSLSWPRVLPDGQGTPNEAGLDFYDRLIDGLLAAGITPWVTLYHWDLPYALHCRGGWLNPAMPEWFAAYTDLVATRLGDRVKHWLTLNEPAVFVGLGYRTGEHAPGLKVGLKDTYQIAHHALLAHGKAVQVLRARVSGSQVGLANVGAVCVPATDSPADIAAAHTAMFGGGEPYYWQHHFWADPMLKGHYRDGVLDWLGADAPTIGPDDMATIHQPLDYYGMNLYQGTPVRAGQDGLPEGVPTPTGDPVTLFHWPVTPEALYWGPRFLYERYELPIVIMENGLSLSDWVSLDGAVHDPQRIDFTQRYLLALRRAGADGVKLGGYFHWSIMDNFEWAEGMKHRFGMIHMDFQTQQRTLKDSAYWYRDVIASHGAALDGSE